MKKWIGRLCMTLLVLGAAGIFFRSYYNISYINIKMEESGEQIANPFRGFYYQADTSDGALPEKIEENNLRLLLLTFDLKEEKEERISDAKMDELEIMLKAAKEAGIQVIFRAAYGFGSEYRYNEPALSTVLRHIEQMAPVLNTYEENLLCVQAGLLGPWGEWHHSRLLEEGEADGKEVRNLVIAAWVEQLNEPVTLQVRRPRFARDAIEAGIPAKRLGIHNDALLSSSDDMGTYDDASFTREEELSWVETYLSRGSNGGEMPSLSEYTEPEHAQQEFEKLHLSYLNSSYNKEVLEDWKNRKTGADSAYSEIEKRLGYRLSINKIQLPEALFKSQDIEISFTLSNSGYAYPPAGYKLYVAADNGESTVFYPAETTLSVVSPGESESFFIRLPAAKLPNGKGKEEHIRLGLYLDRNAEKDVESREKTAIQLANNEILWENGINYFGSYETEGGRRRFLQEKTGSGRAEEFYGESPAGENFASEDSVAEDSVDIGRLEMTVFKIGKADALLLMSGENTLLIDTGEDEDAQEILEYLEEKGIEKIDVLLISHFDKDHVGGADKIIEAVEIGTVYQPDYPKDSGQYEEYVRSMRKKGIEPVSLQESVHFSCGEMQVYIYPPEEDYYEEENDYSLAATVIHGENRFFFAGDAESERMKELIENGDKIEGGLVHDFLKVPHHGREDEMLESFITNISPSKAVITCSAKNPPDKEVTDFLEECGIEVYLTMNGNIYMVSDGKNITVLQ